MKYEFYDYIEITDDFTVFNFVSEGKKGSIPKRVIFAETDWDNVYNLGFGDVNEDGELDDRSVSDNGDKQKILATLVRIVDKYSYRYPDHWIMFAGSTQERTRLYRMVVGLHFMELSEKFEIYALIDGAFIPFVKNMEISTFLIKRKSIKFIP